MTKSILSLSIDCEQSLFFFRFSESNARARERRSRETRETRAAAISHARGHLRVSRFARPTTEKRETARSLPLALRSNICTKSHLKICFRRTCFHRMLPCHKFLCMTKDQKITRKDMKQFWNHVLARICQNMPSSLGEMHKVCGYHYFVTK